MVQQNFFNTQTTSVQSNNDHLNNNENMNETLNRSSNNNNNNLQSRNSFTNSNNLDSFETIKLNKIDEASEHTENNKLRLLNTLIKDELSQIRHAYQDDIDYHNELKNKSDTNAVIIERQGGLSNRFVILLLLLWYLFSALTLYTNKYIVTSRKIDPTIIGTVQMIVTTLCGYAQLTMFNTENKYDCLPQTSSNNKNKGRFFSVIIWRNMLIIGFLRLFSLVLGLMALKQATVSFVETVKSSSPLFTVVISRILIGEITGFWTNVSLMPIMFGLALCSSFEMNFSIFGFVAAILTNFTECLQNVFSKLLLCSDQYKFTPLEVQLFSSASSVIVLIPTCYLTVDLSQQNYQLSSLILYLINGVCFNCQSLLAFTLMSYISPVTYSVCNTLKRALLIWFSVIIFQNQVGYMSAFGTAMVILGVLYYNHSRNKEKLIKSTVLHKI